jgi:septal ring factor EnvC (AmiA/AmiB activator)
MPSCSQVCWVSSCESLSVFCVVVSVDGVVVPVAEQSWQSKLRSAQDESSVRLEAQTREFAERSAVLTAQLAELSAEQERLAKQLASSESKVPLLFGFG